jgi:4-hydroxythreonine-4-phosphate dehydrogenase
VHNSVVLGITAGDPSGIGPEVALKALRVPLDRDVIPVLIARYSVLQLYYADLLSGYEVISKGDEPHDTLISGHRYIYDIDLDLPVPRLGIGTIYTGIESKAYIDAALSLWKSGVIHGIVTGPVNKGFIEKSGCIFKGHTGYLAEQIGEPNPFMMMYSEEYRVILVTSHLPIEEVSRGIDEERIYRTIKVGYDAISLIDGSGIRVAITGLDPHCGDDGAIGDFDVKYTRAAVDRARRDGILIDGPFAADTLFLPERWKSYNLVVAHYHDQALIPFKILAFERGVNVTVGLSLTRTSVDHGTAYDIAGRGIAKSGSMVEAIKLAGILEKKEK